MNLFSILIADQPAIDPSSLPPAIGRNVASFQQHHPGIAHRFYDQHAIRAFLRQHMEADVLQAYDCLLPYAYRADLARLCLLHEYGGAYADLSVFFHDALPLESGKLVVFRDRAVHAPWIVSNTIIGAPARLPAFEAAIRMIVAHCHQRYRGVSALCPTGPVLFGKAIAMHCEATQIHLGEVLNVAQRETTESLAFVDATDGRLVAYRTKNGAGLRGLGLHQGVNNYNDFYDARLIYAGDYPVTVSAGYLAQHGATAGTMDDDHLVIERGHADEPPATVLLCHLPLPFAAGAHRVLLDLAQASAGALTMVASTRASHEVLAHATFRAGAGAGTLAMPLDIAASRDDVVVGLLAEGGARLRIAGLRIERLLPQSTP
jgi:hypothetical protein